MICIAIVIASVLFSSMPALAGDNSTALGDLTIEVDKQLAGLDFSAFEKILSGLSDDFGLFGNQSFLEKVGQALQGGFGSTDQLFPALLKLFFADFLKFLPLVAIVAAIAILANLLQGVNARTESSKVIYYACFCGILLVVSAAVVFVLNDARNAVLSMQTQMNLTFPIILTMMSAIGSVSTVAVYQPMVALLTQGVASLMSYVILPIFIVSYVLLILSSLNPDVKLSKLSEMFASASKWLIGIVFTVFSAFLSVQGIYAGIHDGVSFRTAKYAMSHYVPIVGGYLSDGLNMILAGSMLIKNSVGIVSVLLLLATVLSPILYILGLKLALMLLGAVLEPLHESAFSNFCSKLSKSLNLLIAVVVSVAFMYFISLVLMICSANYVVGT